MTTCAAYDVWGGYVLRCILPAGHDGDHLASDLEPVEPAAGPEQQPPPVPAVSGPVASPTTTAPRRVAVPQPTPPMPTKETR